jgi:trehalose 6-phosphate synthase
MSGRLIVVSNRIPTEEEPSGGLVVALHEALSETGGLWIGAYPDTVEEPTDELIDLPGGGYARKAFRLTSEERRTYYLGYANSVLWPLCHRRSDLIDFERAFAEGYLAVNRRVARAVAALAGPDDLVWIHDYHFLPLAAMLRALGVNARIGLFLHIPFPVLADLDALPERADFPGWIAAFDVVGLQTEADVARCRELFRGEEGSELLPGGRMRHGGRDFAACAFPIGIDAEAFAQAAAVGGGEYLVNLGPREDLVIGVDRLDYSKGLPNRFRAFGQFLDGQQKGDRRASLLQIAPPSREEVGAYQDIRDELERLSGCINGRHAELDWTPIRYIHRGLPREQLAVLYRAARVGLVTPLADGMNLVAKEYVAAQDPENPGVLVLSRMAGAAEELTEALLVNPYDIEEMATAIDAALGMSRAERQRRHRVLLEVVRRNDVGQWRRACLDALRRVERHEPVS